MSKKRIPVFSVLVLLIFLSCHDSGPEPEVFQPEDLVGSYSGVCYKETRYFNTGTGQWTITHDTTMNEQFYIDSLEYKPSSASYLVHTHGACQFLTNFFVPEDSLKVNPVWLRYLSTYYDLEISIDTSDFHVESYYNMPEQGKPGGVEIQGHFEKN